MTLQLGCEVLVMMTHFQEALTGSQRKLSLIYKDETEKKAGRKGMDYWGCGAPLLQKHGWKQDRGTESLSFSESLIRSLVRTEY